MGNQSDESVRPLKWLVTCVALGSLVVRLVFPQLKIDAVALGLLVLALLPWLSPLIKSAKLPGGFEIEFQDVKGAADRAVSSVSPALQIALSPEPTFLAIAEQDPNLALVGLRIEIEKRLRRLAEQANLPANQTRSLVQLTTQLQRAGVLEPEAAGGLRDLITLGNQAAHGRTVSPDVALSAADYAPRVLQALDSRLIQGSTGAA